MIHDDGLRDGGSRDDGHVAFVCSGNHDDGGVGCWFCDGGLFACTRCGALEGATPDECPGEEMSADRRDEVHRGHVNYRGGRWRDETCLIMMPLAGPDGMTVLRARVAELRGDGT